MNSGQFCWLFGSTILVQFFGAQFAKKSQNSCLWTMCCLPSLSSVHEVDGVGHLVFNQNQHQSAKDDLRSILVKSSNCCCSGEGGGGGAELSRRSLAHGERHSHQQDHLHHHHHNNHDDH